MKIVGFIATLISALVLGACFETPTANVSFRCGPAGECPSDYECRDDGCCHLLGAPQIETCEPAVDAGAVIDGAVVHDANTDAALPDAMAPDAMALDASVNAVLVSVEPTTATITMGQMMDLTVTLDRLAPVGGTTVTLMSSDAGIASVDASVTVPEGAMSQMFAVTGVAVGMATITTSLDGNDFDSIVTVVSAAAAAGDNGNRDSAYFVSQASLQTVD